MQQGSGSDVSVEERHGAAQLTEAEPEREEVGLVAHEERHRVSALHRALEHARDSVAALLERSVAERLSLADQEGFVGNPLGLLNKPIHDRHDARAPLVDLQTRAVPQDSHQEQRVSPEVREAPALREMRGDEPRQQRRDPRPHHSPVKAL